MLEHRILWQLLSLELLYYSKVAMMHGASMSWLYEFLLGGVDHASSCDLAHGIQRKLGGAELWVHAKLSSLASKRHDLYDPSSLPIFSVEFFFFFFST